MAYPSRQPSPGGTPDRPKRYLIESRYTADKGASGVVAEVYSPGQHGRVPYPDTAQRILLERQAQGEPGRRYHHVRIVDKGSQTTVCQAGVLEPELATA